MRSLAAVFDDYKILRVVALSMICGTVLLFFIVGHVRDVSLASQPSEFEVRHDGEALQEVVNELASELLDSVDSDPLTDTTAPRYEIIHNVETVWSKTSSAPDAIALLFHGCSHSATDWFDRSSSCQYCGFGRGGWALPEEKSIVQEAQRRNFAIVVMSSDDRAGSKCWSGRKDMPKIGKALDSLLTRPDNADAMDTLPIFVFGASSGGSFASMIPSGLRRPDGSNFNIQGLGIQISGGQGLQHVLESGQANDLPPVAFLHMPKDSRTARAVAARKSRLEANSVPVLEITMEASPIDESFFSNRITEVC